MSPFIEFLQEYKFPLIILTIVLVISLVLVSVANPLDFSNDSDAMDLNSLDINSNNELIADANFSEEHLALAANQKLILIEIQKLNLFSQCIVDTENISTQEIPIDNQGGFRRVSVVTLVCPEILPGEGFG
ncbi:hypothetical protein LCGC14_1187580 [marine sediment metagenome]|uniref:Uncharacterized protein n=1 Tax=marine sediment metagenome TaxID=412755 RepID=A0A0F9LQ63_9ZZZZ